MEPIGNGPSAHFAVEDTCVGPAALVRHRHIRGIRLDDFDEFREDDLPVFAAVGAPGAGDVFVDGVTGSNIDTVPSIPNVIVSHLLNDPNGLHKQAGSGSFLITEVCVKHPLALSGDTEILARGAESNAVNWFDLGTIDFCNISEMLHSTNAPFFRIAFSQSRRG